MSKMKSSPPSKAAATGKPKGRGGCVIFVGFLIVAVIIAFAVLGLALRNGFSPGQAGAQLSGLEDHTSPEAVIARREQAQARLNGYGWVDEASGVVNIPIERAMALIVETALPVGTEGLETATPTEAAPTFTPTPEAAETPASDGASTATPTVEPSPTIPPLPTVDLANVSFNDHVLPILEQHCVQCHGGEQPEGGQRIEDGLLLTSYEDIITGSWNGTVVEPGDVEDSYLIEQISTGRMPKEGEKLSSVEVEIITAWVEAGALNN